MDRGGHAAHLRQKRAEVDSGCWRPTSWRANCGQLAAAALALTVLPLSLLTTAQAAAAVPKVLPIGVAVSALRIADESRDGYDRDAFKHWNAGENRTDGCDIRRKVLIAEAVELPVVGPRCMLTGGIWWSYYDEQIVTSTAGHRPHGAPGRGLRRGRLRLDARAA
ncbi:hypothetical protein [Streptomyces sp. NPDC051000]|uniref:hypothetical protein n=1 Tax=Streptomyces sp. NPDC051000 TaxID=3155520 RepID=UPI0033C0FA2E